MPTRDCTLNLLLGWRAIPRGVQAWAGDRLRTGLTQLMESPTLMRAARFLVLSTDRHLQSKARFDEL
jgi:hypothetical protein